MLEAAGRLVPKLGVVAFQCEALADLPQQLGDQAQLIGEGGVQQEICRGLETLDIPRLVYKAPLADISAGGFFLLLNRFGFYYLLILLYLCGIMYCTKK